MKSKFILMCILLIFIISFSTVYAESNDTEIYQNTGPTQNFNALNSQIQNTPENGVLVLESNYTLNQKSEENTYKEGINIDKNITIDGNNHVIDGKNLVRIFNINSNVLMKNIVLVNGYHSTSENGGGAININSGCLYLENSILLNNSAYSTTKIRGTGLSDGGGAICVDGGTFTAINCSFYYNRIYASANVGGGAIMLKSGSNSTINNCIFINNTAISYSGASFGGAIAELGNIGNITNSTFINNGVIIGQQITANNSSIIGNQFINTKIYYWFSSAGLCEYNTFINSDIYVAPSSPIIKHNWYGYNPSKPSDNIVAHLINNERIINFTLLNDGYGNNLSNPEYLYPRNVEFNGNVKYDNLTTINGIAVNEINETLIEGKIYSVKVHVDEQILNLYFKYCNSTNNNITISKLNETYNNLFPGEIKIKGKDKIYHSLFEAINDAQSMNNNVTIYLGEGIYTEKWSDEYYNYEYSNYNFNFTSNNNVITIIGAGNDKSIIKGETQGFGITGNSQFKFVNITFKDFTENIFTFNINNSTIGFINCAFKNISTKYAIYLSGKNSILYIDGCYFDEVHEYPFWNNADNSYIVIDSTIFNNVNYNYAFSEILTENDYENHISNIYHDFNKYYVFKHNILLSNSYEGFDVTPKTYISSNNIKLGDTVTIIVDFNYFTNTSGTYKFDSNFIEDYHVLINTSEGLHEIHLKDGIAILEYTPTESGEQTISIKYGDKIIEQRLNVINREKPYFNVEGKGNIVATLPDDATGSITFNVNNQIYNQELINGNANINLEPLDDIKYTVNIIYSGDSKYTPINKTIIFSPKRNITHLNINCNDTLVYNNATIKIYTNADGNMKIIVDEKEYNNITVNNIATFIIGNLTFGKHDITAIYEGNSNYLPEQAKSTINIIKNIPTLSSYVKTVISGEEVIMNITLNKDITSEVYIFLKNKVYKTNIVNGTGHLNFKRLHGGNYTYMVHFNGNDKYYPLSDYSTFSVIKLDEIHVDVKNGDDENMGISENDALKSLRCAMDCISNRGTIYIHEGIYFGIDNTNLTLTQQLKLIGIGDATIDGELKNYFFKIDDNADCKIRNINFKNIYYDSLYISKEANVTVENCEFNNGYGSAIKNNGKLYIYNSTFNQLISSKEGLAIANYGNSEILNCTFKNSNAHGMKIVNGIIYNEGSMSIERSIFNNNTPYEIDYTSGSYNIFNSGKLDAKHNIFLNTNHEKLSTEELGRILSPYIFSDNDDTYLSLNYFDVNENPYNKYVNIKINEYFILDVENDYYSIDIGEKTNITAILKLNNGEQYDNYKLMPDIFLTIDIGGEKIIKKLIDGKSTFEFNQSNSKGQYKVDIKLGDCVKTVVIDVGKETPNMAVEYDEIYYGDTAVFNINITGNYTHQPTGNIIVKIDGKEYNAKIRNEKAKIKIANLNAETYDLKIIYGGDKDYSKAIFNENYTVHKKSIHLKLNVSDVYYGENGCIITNIDYDKYTNQAYLTVFDDSNNRIVKKTVFVRNGTRIPLNNLASGIYYITLELWNSSKYESPTASAVFIVKKFETNLTVNTSDVMAGETAYLNITLAPEGEVAGEANLTINNKTEIIYLKNGNNTVKLENLTGGSYNITISFLGDKKYANSSANAVLNVKKHDTTMDVTVEEDKITVKVNQTNATGIVNLYINDQLQKLNLTNGTVTFTPNYNRFNNSIFVYYEGDGYFNYTTFNATYENNKLANLTGYDVLTYDGESGTIYVTLTDESGYGIAGKNITISINNKKYTKTTNQSGIASLTLTLPIGNYTITSKYNNYTAENTFTVLKNINMTTVGDIEVYDNERFQYYVKLTDGRNNNIENAEVTFTVNGQKYINKTNNNGIARIFLTLNKGNYTITAKYKTESITNKINVRENDNYTLTANDLEMYYRDGSVFNVTLKDGNGNTLSGRIITFTINNNTYQRTTDKNGVASLQINLASGLYEIKTTYIDTSTTNKILIKDYPVIITGEDVEMYYRDGTNYTVSLKDTRGIALTNVDVIFTVDGENYTRTTNKDGIASITINLPEGTYTITASYKNASTTNKIVVKDYAPVITGNDVEMYYHDGTNYTITLKNTQETPISNVEVIFTVEGENYTRATNKDGIASITINLPEGVYSITATYRNVSTTNKIIVKDYEPVITGSDVEMYYRDGTNYTITLKNTQETPISNVDVIFNINNRNYTRITDSNGIARITINLPAGTYTIKATYKNASTTNKVTVKDYEPVIAGSDVEMYYRDGTNYTITLKNTKGTVLSNRIVTFNINNRDYNRTTNSNGEASVTINLPAGTYTIKVTYANASTTNKITVKEYAPVITGNDVEMYYRDGTNYTITLKNSKGDILSNKVVTFNVDGDDYNRTTNSNGEASLTINLPAGTYTIKTTYKNASITNRIAVKEYPTVLTTEDLEMYFHDNSTFKATLTNTNDDVLTNRKVTFTIGNETYTGTTNNQGVASITINLAPGNYTIKTAYQNLTKTNNIEIRANYNLETEDLIMTYKDGSRFTAKLTDKNGNTLKNATVLFTINGQPYTRTTNNEGIASIAINLNSGTHTITTRYQEEFKTNKITIKATVEAKDVVKVYRNATQYYAKFTDNTGKLLKNTTVTFNINGVYYTRTTNESGVAKLNLNLQQGKYVLTATNPVTGENAANNITILPTITENRDVTKYYRNATQYTVKLIKPDGSIAGAGEKVTFNINGVYYERTVNESGIAKLNINLNPGDYIITAEYAGCKVSNNIKVLPTIKAQDLTKKYGVSSPFTATLLDGTGKALANEKISFNINGVFYTRTTDADGIAKLNINLQAGKYIITSSYNGLNVANTVTVQS